MWKRIQNLYLAIATILIASMFFCNVATIASPNGEVLTIKYIEKTSYLIALIFISIGNLLTWISMKVPFFQMRVCSVTAIMNILFQVVLLIDFFMNTNEMRFSLTALFPAAAGFLGFLASRQIMLDATMALAAKRFNELGSSKKK